MLLSSTGTYRPFLDENNIILVFGLLILPFMLTFTLLHMLPINS